jgi:hypothetical protein
MLIKLENRQDSDYHIIGRHKASHNVDSPANLLCLIVIAKIGKIYFLEKKLSQDAPIIFNLTVTKGLIYQSALNYHSLAVKRHE